jgi:hypothetical protein
MKNKIQRLVWLGGILTFGLIGYLFAQTTTPGTGTLEARLRANANGTVSVFFRGVPGESYQIRFTVGNPGDTSAWGVVVTNIVAGNGWTEWVDTHAPAVGQWFYQVVPQIATASAKSLASPGLTVVLTNTVPSLSISEAANQANADALASNQWLHIQEAADGGRLIGAVNAGDYKTALAILQQYGISSSTLQVMASRLGQPPTRAVLNDAFLKASISVSLQGSTEQVQARLNTITALGYGQMIWMARSKSLDRPGWEGRYDAELAKCPLPPIGAVEEGLQEVNVIEFFKWYDRYAERLHSVALNWSHLANYDNESLQVHDYVSSRAWLNGMYQLVKARKPDAFVWVSIVRMGDDSDLQWLEGLGFAPDGLMVRNQTGFDAHYGQTRNLYLPIVGQNTPMMVAGFFGYESVVTRSWQALDATTGISNPRQKQVAQAQAVTSMKAVGKVIGPELSEEEQHLQSLGYRGIAADWPMLQAVSLAGQ